MRTGFGRGHRIGPRDTPSRLALAVKLLVGTAVVVVAAVRYGLLGAALVVSMGLLLAALAQRQKAASVPEARWTAPADLLVGDRQFPGQLSVLSHAIVWLPSNYSLRHGIEEVRTDRGCSARVTAGPALGDVYVSLISTDGKTTTFLTRRSRRLAAVIDGFDPRNR